ncbi:hypothetical protein KWH78_14930 [Morganella morganii]|uniref:hypothetical protein n=1 Tax=Morganella morganii TaxID=582 RepID=UPI0021CDF6D5|nr:hypothetical protein [Morganella morganii]MCU6212404.1 hypothetical protein [Morganella morganii]
MIWLVIYGAILSLIAVIYYFKDWYKLTYDSLTSQGLFWGAIFVPLLSFLYFGIFSWQGCIVDMSSAGLNKFIMISKLPLGLLSLSIPFVAIIASLHRSIQTAAQISSTKTQIELIKKKNSLDELFSREKNFVDKCTYIEKQIGDIEIKLKDDNITFKFNICEPHALFRKVYNTTPNDDGINYQLTDFIRSTFLLELSTIEENLELHYKCIANNNGMGVDDELSRLFIIVRALCRSLDLLSVSTCQVPYFYIPGNSVNFQIFISTEEELKMWLKKYIIISESLLGAINYPRKHSMFNMKKYVFEGFLLFPSFSEGSVIQNHFGISWESTVNAFKKM